ncbi:MAG: MFS transporter [Prevotella sp.]
MDKKPNRLWTSSFVKICLVNFFIFVNFHALLPTFPFFVTYLGGDAVAIGVATALFSIASIVSRPFVGWLVDSKGRCTVLVVGLVGMALIPMGYFISAGIAMAVLLRTVHGAFHAASSNASSTWVTDIIPPARMGEGLGMYGLSMAISTAVAPALGLMIMNRMGFPPLFVMTTAAAIVALLLGAGIRNRAYKLSDEPLRLKDLFEPMSVPASITQFFFMMAYGVIEVYVAIYATSHGLPGGGIYFICIAIATVATRILLGRTIDRYGEAVLVYSGNAAIILGILLLVFVHNVPSYVLSALLLGFSFGAIQPSLQTMAMHTVAPERRGAASSTFFVAFDFGIALGGFLAGLLVKSFGYDTMFIIIAFSCVLSAAYYYAFGRRHASSFNPKSRITHFPSVPHAASASADTEERDALRRHALAADIPGGKQPTADKPLIVTISRQYGSGGHEVGELLAQKLGVKLYDKNLIAMTAEKSGMKESDVAETEQKAGGFMTPDDPIQTAMFQTQSRVIRDIAANGSCVIVGRLANFILRDEANCFNIFIYASPDYRRSRIAESEGIAPDAAGEKMLRTDRDRADHCLHYTGCDWGRPKYYHLMVDNAVLGDRGTADMIYEMIGKIRSFG